MRRPGRFGDGVRGAGRDAGRQAPDALQEGGRDRRAHPVERRDRDVHRLRPASQLRQPGLVPLRLRSVVPVVAGQVEAGQMDQRVAPVQLQFPEHDPGVVLERGEMRLVVHILERVTRLRRLRKRRQPGAHPVRRQILDGTVILVTPGELARLGDVEIANGPQPRGQVIIHGPTVSRAAVPPWRSAELPIRARRVTGAR